MTGTHWWSLVLLRSHFKGHFMLCKVQLDSGATIPVPMGNVRKDWAATPMTMANVDLQMGVVNLVNAQLDCQVGH